ncbi:MAG: hypothetical protein ABIX28_23760 [Vicinamibacterales bacterium]
MGGLQNSPGLFSLVIGLAIVAGAACGYVYGRFQRWSIRRHSRSIVREMLRGAESLRTECELRPDVLWCKTANAEVSLPWSRFQSVNDTDGGVELWFDPGLAIVRNRAVAEPDDRRAFIETVTRLGHPGVC